MKTSIKRIQEFVNASKVYKKKYKDETKLMYAIRKVEDRAAASFREYFEAKEDIELEHANTDEKGSVLFTFNSNGAREYQFTKEELKVVRVKLKKLFTDERFEIKPHICDELPPDFNEEFREYFEDFVLGKKETEN